MVMIDGKDFRDKLQEAYRLLERKLDKTKEEVLTSFLSQDLKPKTVVEVKINIVKGVEDDI